MGVKMPDDPKTPASLWEHLLASRQKRDGAEARSAGEELLRAHLPREIRGGLHYLIGEAMVESAAPPSDSDLEAAIGHFEASTSADATKLDACIQIGRAEI